MAEEYKICTLHVTCHSQVKHMWIPIASAPSHFQFQRLSTRYSHFIYCFPQIRQGFMGVNAFRHSRAGVSEYHLDGRFIGSCSVEHCGQRVAALMGRVVHVQLFYGVVKEAAEGFVVVTGADFSSRFPLCQDGQDFLVDGDFPNPRQRLAFLHVDVLLAEVHITGGEGNVLSRPHSRVNQNQHVFHAFHCIDRFPQLSYLAGGEWPFDVNGNVLRKLQKAAEVRFHNSVLHGVLKELAQEHTAFLFRAVSPRLYRIKGRLNLLIGQTGEWQRVEGRKMFIADFIGRAGRGSDGFKVAAAPCMVERRECDFFSRRHAVHADEEGESLFSVGKVAKRALAAVYRLFDNPRPPPVPRELVHRSISIGKFHFIQFPFYS